MKTADLQKMEEHDLHKHVAAQREELLRLRFQLATGALENTSRLREVKHGVARALTVLNSRRDAGDTVTPAAATTSTVEQEESSDA